MLYYILYYTYYITTCCTYYILYTIYYIHSLYCAILHTIPYTV